MNGEPLRNRNGEPIARVERVRILLPACDGCNGKLNSRFETPAKDSLRRLFGCRGEIVLNDREAQAVGLWLVKTLLLQAHPASRYSDSVVDQHALRWEPNECPSPTFFRWMVTGAMPPDGISLWIFRTDESVEDADAPEFHLPLPMVAADGETVAFNCFQVSFHGIQATVVVHPGWPIDHPLESDGRAVRLWPSTGPVDFTRLPLLSRRAVSWFQCNVRLRDGVLGSPELPPLSASTLPFGALPQMAPYIELWSA